MAQSPSNTSWNARTISGLSMTISISLKVEIEDFLYGGKNIPTGKSSGLQFPVVHLI